MITTEIQLTANYNIVSQKYNSHALINVTIHSHSQCYNTLQFPFHLPESRSIAVDFSLDNDFPSINESAIC